MHVCVEVCVCVCVCVCVDVCVCVCVCACFFIHVIICFSVVLSVYALAVHVCDTQSIMTFVISPWFHFDSISFLPSSLYFSSPLFPFLCSSLHHSSSPSLHHSSPLFLPSPSLGIICTWHKFRFFRIRKVSRFR